MDLLFEVSFSRFEEVQINSKVSPKCGICNRYMKYINLRPPRLYCSTCEATFKLPTFQKTGGKIRQHNGVCPLDHFDLLAVTSGLGKKQYTVCPKCYNGTNTTKGVTCADCPNLDCQFSLAKISVGECPECEGAGKLCLNPLATQLDCNLCIYSMKLPKARSIKITSDADEDGDTILEWIFGAEAIPPVLLPLFGKSEEKTLTIRSSIFADNEIGGLIESLNERHGGGRGRGRGRGRRGGRGRGRGRKQVDPRMSFNSF